MARLKGIDGPDRQARLPARPRRMTRKHGHTLAAADSDHHLRRWTPTASTVTAAKLGRQHRRDAPSAHISTASRTRSAVCTGMTAEFLPALSLTGLVEPVDQRRERGERFAYRLRAPSPASAAGKEPTSP